MKKIIKLITVFSMLLSLVGCHKKEYQYLKTTFTGPFDTITQFNAYVESQEQFDEYTTIIKETFTRLDQLFDKYTSYPDLNNIKTINDQSGIAPVEVDPVIIDLIDMWTNEFNSVSSKVNIALGPVLELWHNAREEANTDTKQPIGIPPSLDELQEASQYCSTDYLVVDKEKNTVYLTDEHCSLDVGAIAKGYAVEYVKDILIEKGAESFLISAGGNVAGHGNRMIESEGMKGLERSKTEFNVALNSPRDGAYEELPYVAYMICNDVSIVTSGDYERYFLDEQGNRYSHLVDGDTLYPPTYFRSVTVITEDSGYADFLSTSLFLMDEKTGYDFVSKLDDVEAIWCLNDGTMITTDGLVSGDNFLSLVS